MDSSIHELVGLKPPPAEIFEFQLPVHLTQDAEQRGVRNQGGFYFPDNDRTTNEGYVPGKGCFEYFREYDGHPAPLFPASRVPFWDTINMLAPIKRQLAMVFQFASSEEARDILIFAAARGGKWRGRMLNRLSQMFNDIAMGSIRFKYLKDEYYCLSVREIIGFTERILVLLGVTRENAYRTARTVGMMFENDNAYCWRFEDMMMDADKQAMMDDLPKAAERMVQTLIDHDPNPQDIQHKYHAILKALKYAWMVPSIRKALRKAIEPMNMENCKLTENDIYHTLLYSSYNIQGKSPEERLKIYEEYHGTDQSKWPARWSLG